MQSVIDDVSRLIAARASIGWECWEYQSGSPPKNAMADPAFQLAHRQWVFCGQATGNRIREHRIWCSYKDEANLEELFRIAEEWMGVPPNFRVPTLSVFVWQHNQDLLVNGIIKYSWRLARLLDLIFESIEDRRLLIQNALNSDEPGFEVHHVVNHDLLRSIRAYLSEPVRTNGSRQVSETTPPPVPKKGIEAAKWWIKRDRKPKLTTHQCDFVERVLTTYEEAKESDGVTEGETLEVIASAFYWGDKPDVTANRLCERINETVLEAIAAKECEHFFKIELSDRKRLVIRDQ